MKYNDFGKTGLKISSLGFGAMRLPIPANADKMSVDGLGEAVDLLRYGIDQGINYVDTAYMYCDHRSERAVGLAIADRRDRVILSTKCPTGNVKKQDDFFRILDEQLARLDTGTIDFYHLHGIGRHAFENTVQPLKLIDLAQKAIDDGRIRHLSFSFHDGDASAMRPIIDTGAFSSVLCQYNLLDRSNADNIRYAHERGLGVVVMGPVGGGRLAFKGGVFEDALGGSVSTPELAIRFVLSNPGVSCALSGMENRAMVDGNVKQADIAEPLSPHELAAIENVTRETAKLKELYCTGCRYCIDACPKHIDIAACFEALIYDKVYKFKDIAAKKYRHIARDDRHTASACIKCGACEPKCPQNIRIRDELAECVNVFGS